MKSVMVIELGSNNEYFRIPPLFNTLKTSKVLVFFALYCLSQNLLQRPRKTARSK